ncbi:MAG: sulfotransferase [Gammaproteobacteria bacterium]|nr:sulfotransferase [Gammaproteobacteria bacterium]
MAEGDQPSPDDDIASLSYMAQQHYRNGRLQRAREACQRILEKEQRADAILLLGMIAHEQKAFETAAQHYEDFLRLEPEHARAHYYHGLSLIQLGQAEAAVEHLQKSISLDPGNRTAHIQLGDACTRLGRWEEASGAYCQALALQPDDLGTTVKLGNVYLAGQFFADAAEIYERTLELLPDNAVLHRHLGAVLHRMGQTRKAIDCLERAIELRPDYAKARIDLALVYRQLERTVEAMHQIQEAIHYMPDDVDAHISLALTMRQEGRMAYAARHLSQLLAIQPVCGAAYYHLSMIRPPLDLIPRIRRLLDDPALPEDDAIYCHFALGNVLDTHTASDLAFDHYRLANTLKRRSLVYDPRDNTRVFEKLIETYSKGFFERKRGLGCDSDLPVFIVGLPRSGTTLVEQILASHGSIHGAGELESFAGVNHAIAHRFRSIRPAPDCMSLIDQETVDEFSARYLEELRLRSRTAARVVDKLPGNFVRIGLIKTLFPNAHVVHCSRNALDTCVSLYFHYFQALTCSFDLRELGQYYLDYRHLMDHWEALFPDRIFEVRYEELVNDPERISRALVDYLDLPWDERCLEFYKNTRAVMSPSNIQVRHPVYKVSVDRWKRYEKHLGPLIEVLDTAKGGSVIQ